MIHGIPTRHRGKSRKSKSNNRDQITKNSKGGSELERKGHSPKQIRLQGNGQVHAILQGLEKGLSVD